MAHKTAEEGEHGAAVLAAGSTFARYEIVRCIGVGGMGAVFEATHTMLRKRVALKTLHANLVRSDAARERFLREAETVARIRHPNVVDITDVGVEGGVPYLVMEYLEGDDLAKVLERTGRLTPAEAADTLVPVISGLVAVHRLGIVHRDIKPENILLSRDAHGGFVPKLLDFGVSKDLDASLRSGLPPLHTVTGTPHYMSPEQARGSASLDSRTDQYAVGILLFQCLSGVRPYDSESLLELLHLIDTGEHPSLRTYAADLPVELEQVVHRAMARHPRDRFETTEAFGRALLPFASERVRFTYERDFLGEGSRRASSMDVLSPERANAVTVPAFSSAVSTHTGSGVRMRRTSQEKASRVRMASALAGALIVAAGGVWAWHARRGERQAEAPSAAAGARAEAAEGPALRRTELDLTVEPSEARIELDGAWVGTGRLLRPLSLDGTPHRLRIHAPGYAERLVEFTDVPPQGLVRLEKLAAQGRSEGEPGQPSVQAEGEGAAALHTSERPLDKPGAASPSARKPRGSKPEAPSEPAAPQPEPLDIQLSR